MYRLLKIFIIYNIVGLDNLLNLRHLCLVSIAWL